MMRHGPGMVFIAGFPSSGTDLTKNVMNAHKDVHIGGEFPLLPSLAKRYRSQVTPETLDAIVRDIVGCDVYGNLERKTLPNGFAAPCRFADVYAALLTSRDVRWCGNKTPQNAERIDSLEHLFPDARYVLVVRDVRDVALSWQRKWGKDPLLCAHKWAARMPAALALLRALAPQRHMVLTYESLLDDHRAAAVRICRLLDLPYDPRIDEFHAHVDGVVAGKLNYGAPVLAHNRGKWREGLESGIVRRIEEIAFDAMRLFGYAPSEAVRFKPIGLAEAARGRAREATAMIFVGNRALQNGSRAHVGRTIGLELAKRIGRYRIGRSS